MGFVLRATLSAPGAPGTRVTVHDGEQCWTALRRTGGSYLSASDARMLFALPGRANGLVDADVDWPSGRSERFDSLPTNAYLRLVEGSGRAR